MLPTTPPHMQGPHLPQVAVGRDLEVRQRLHHLSQSAQRCQAALQAAVLHRPRGTTLQQWPGNEQARVTRAGQDKGPRAAARAVISTAALLAAPTTTAAAAGRTVVPACRRPAAALLGKRGVDPSSQLALLLVVEVGHVKHGAVAVRRTCAVALQQVAAAHGFLEFGFCLLQLLLQPLPHSCQEAGAAELVLSSAVLLDLYGTTQCSTGIG